MIQIDKVLSAAIRQDAEDIFFTVGRPPMLRLNDAIEPLPTEVLTREDTSALMKSITPERYQQELQETGSADYGFEFQGKAAFRVGAFRQQGNITIVLRLIPSRIRTFQELGLGTGIQELLFKPRGLRPGHRPDRQRQDDDAGHDDRPHQHHPQGPHPDHRGPDRVPPRPQEVHRQPARGRRGRAELHRGPAPRAARGAGRHPRGRNARPGEHAPGHQRLRDRPPRPLHRPHPERPEHRRAHHRRVPAQPAGPDTRPACQQPAGHPGPVPGARARTAAWSPPSRYCWSPPPCGT